MLNKLFNRPEATISTIEEVKALKPFFDGKKHHVVFTDTTIFYSFYKELFEKCAVNNFFVNQVTDNGERIEVNNVPVSEVDDDNKDELIEKHNIPIDDNVPAINFDMTSHVMKDGKWNVTFKVDSEAQKYWDPKADVLLDPEDDEEPSVDDITATIDDADIDEEDSAEV